MIGKVELPAFCCVAVGNFAGSGLKRKRLPLYEKFKTLIVNGSYLPNLDIYILSILHYLSS